MTHRTTPRFWSLYNALPEPVQTLADKQHELLERDPAHPSLHFKKVGRTLWSVRVSNSYRALALEVTDGFLWFWIGSHDEYERIIKNNG